VRASCTKGFGRIEDTKLRSDRRQKFSCGEFATKQANFFKRSRNRVDRGALGRGTNRTVGSRRRFCIRKIEMGEEQIGEQRSLRIDVFPDERCPRRGMPSVGPIILLVLLARSTLGYFDWTRATAASVGGPYWQFVVVASFAVLFVPYLG
jgi:hypothetical protein